MIDNIVRTIKSGNTCAFKILILTQSRLPGSNGKFTPKLEYHYNDVVQGKCPKTKAKRGVCKCAETKKGNCIAKEQVKQDETIIPWCLPHTSNR